MFNRSKLLTVIVILTLTVLVIPANAVPDSTDTSGCIAGTVTDSVGHPLHGATVLIEGTMLGTMTTEEGYYIITDLELGIYRLIAGMVGFSNNYIDSVIVYPGDTTLVNFVIEPFAGSNIITP